MEDECGGQETRKGDWAQIVGRDLSLVTTTKTA